jgi:hypothetical protein
MPSGDWRTASDRTSAVVGRTCPREKKVDCSNSTFSSCGKQPRSNVTDNMQGEQEWGMGSAHFANHVVPPGSCRHFSGKRSAGASGSRSSKLVRIMSARASGRTRSTKKFEADAASLTRSDKLLVAQAVFEYGDAWAEIAEKLAQHSLISRPASFTPQVASFCL